MVRGVEPSRFDQQPLDAMAMVYLYAAWYDYTGDERDLAKATAAYEWFTARNDLGLPLFHRERGSCYDGLQPHGVNRNQGAESTLAYWLSRGRLAEVLAMAEANQDPEREPSRVSAQAFSDDKLRAPLERRQATRARGLKHSAA